MSLPPGPLYVAVHLFLNGLHVMMLFYLYDMRLYIFASQQIPESAEEVFLGEKKSARDDVSVKTTTQLIRNYSFGLGKSNRLEDSGLLQQSTQLQMATYNLAFLRIRQQQQHFNNQFPNPPVQIGLKNNRSSATVYNRDGQFNQFPKPPTTFVDVNRIPTPFNQQGSAPPHPPTGTATSYPQPPYSPSRSEPNVSRTPYFPREEAYYGQPLFSYRC
ncbi:hypothetical protein BJ742DRAFT_746228 [Cladochytrium replicatum]|nr:hypothetical protein BJ742DRAFT_746228 [Cladochytrium replicatum]